MTIESFAHASVEADDQHAAVHSSTTGGRRRVSRRVSRRSSKKKPRKGGFLNRLLVPGALLIGQKSMHAAKKRRSRKFKKVKKQTRKGMIRKTARRAYLKK